MQSEADRALGVDASILGLMAQSVRVMHSPFTEQDAGGTGGGDIDCAVTDLDPAWALRLPRPWRLCQVLRYDTTGWYWVLERGGSFFAIDTLDDPLGLGKYGFPTCLVQGGPSEVSSGVEAAYLSAKRIRKRIDDPGDWSRVTAFARRDVPAFDAALQAVFGRRTAAALSRTILQGSSPDASQSRTARRVQRLRRFRSPARAARALALSIARISQRVAHPTGMFLVLVGPDGTGKSTVARNLPGLTKDLFRRHRAFHWRPGVLPSPGSVVGNRDSDPTDPHGRKARGPVLSIVLLLYYWLDFLIGTLFLVKPLRARSAFVVFERGWWDFLVDPRRYRLDVPGGIVRMLGRLLPSPDLIVVLEANAELVRKRKEELPAEEIARQTDRWRELGAGSPKFAFVDASGPLHDVEENVREAVLDWLERRTFRRLGAGWASLPSRSDPRWVVPRGPRRIASRGLELYQPVTPAGLLGWVVARTVSRVGGFRFLPRGDGPPRQVIEKLRPHLRPGDSVATSRPNHAGRQVARIIRSEEGQDVIAKVAVSERSEPLEALAAEADALHHVRTLVQPPLATPSHELKDGVLLLEAAPWTPRLRPWRLSPAVIDGLGAFYRQGGGDLSGGPSHGDFAPWNLLHAKARWFLLDWEDFKQEAPPFFDVWHYVIQSHALLGRPSPTAIIQALEGKGHVGRALQSYAGAAGLDVRVGREALVPYLEMSLEALDLDQPDGRAGAAARNALLTRIRRR